MGNIYDSNAKTTIRIRKEIQDSKETNAKLATRFSLNPKTVLYWKHAGRVTDKKCGPTNPDLTALSREEEQVLCEFRRQTRFSLDDAYISLRDKITALSHSNLYRCLLRNGFRLPLEENEDGSERKKRFKDSTSDMFISISLKSVWNKKKFYLFVGIDRISKYAFLNYMSV